MKDVHDMTRALYHEIHEREAQNDTMMNRIRAMYTEEYFGLGNDFFKGKKALDVGCGNTGVLCVRIKEFGAAEVHGVDLGDDWIETATLEMGKHNIKNNFFFKPGSVLEIPYEDETFDFVSCNGVLVHLADMEEVNNGFKECVRVCKKGGYFYSSYGRPGGLFEEVIFPALRKYYLENEAFRSVIQNIQPSLFSETFSKIKKGMKHHTGEDIEFKFSDNLFDEDFCLFLKNYIEAPTRMVNECSHQFIKKMYADDGFEDVRLLKRYVERENIRKYFAPLHYDHDDKIAKVLYGEGFAEYIGRKKI